MEHGLVRLIDANANRAGEGLRAMEDLARFVLGDPDLSANLKSARHDLREAVETLLPDRARRLAARDTPGDVGTGISAEAEGRRADTAAIAAAAASRVAEALRTIEEISKLSPTGGGGGVEQLRYRIYELGRRLEVALSGRRARQWKLCVLLTRALCAHHEWTRIAERAIDGGADCIQLREKDMDAREMVRSARALLDIARPRGVTVIINDRADVALAAGADGVHIGQSDLSVRQVRSIGGSSLLVGVSCSTPDHARAAARDGADYIGLGPMFASSTKPKENLAGPNLLRDALADPMTAHMPHLAISGINPENTRDLARAGCRGVAVSSAICASEDPAAACRAILAALDS